jgi:hypothetical protein
VAWRCLVSRDAGGEPLAEQVAAAVMSAVEGQGAGAVQEVHALGEPPALGLDDQVLVGRHQTEGVAAPAAALDFGGEQTQEEPTARRRAERSLSARLPA